jgi:Histidine kinase-, DNA gyrase B-, and HSP90-like ATPase
VEFDLAAPDPAGLVASLSSLGYSLEAAIADLVDNSISANAKRVDVEFTWAGRESWVAVVDDGEGMTPPQLKTAMTVAARGPALARAANDLGRFGVGLKSASFSQSRQLSVASATEGNWTVRTWDLDLVENSSEWRLLRGADEDTIELIQKLVDQRSKGTVVIWRRLKGYDSHEIDGSDQATQKQFYAEATQTRAHLGMVFARFLSGTKRLALQVSGTAVQPWDPFMRSHASVQRLPSEELPIGDSSVRVEAFVLPSTHRMSPELYMEAAGPRGWLGQQGFYVYRRDRLILAGDWLGLYGLRREEKYNLARIAIDIPAETDVEWGVDVRKSSVVPPVPLRRHLSRLADNTRTKAAEVLRHRGQIAARTHGDPLVFAWEVRRRDGVVSCKINRQHPLVRAAVRGGEQSDAVIRALLRLLEETVPVTALRVMHETDTADDPVPFDGLGAASVGAIEVAEQIFSALVSQGRTPKDARQQLGSMQPFDQIRGFWNDA